MSETLLKGEMMGEYEKVLMDKWELVIERIEESNDAVSMLQLEEDFGKETIYEPNFAFFLLGRILREWVDVEDNYYDIIANWIIGTYFMDYFVSYPYLFINAVKRSGKTRLLKVIAKLAFNGIYTASLTEAVLFRMPAARQCTFSLDEAEKISGKDKASLRLLLNSAYKKGMKIYRARKNVKSEHYEIDEFEIFMPIAIANIKGIDDVLEDRCITIIMERSANFSITSKPEFFELDLKFSVFRHIIRQLSSEVSVCSYMKSKYYIIRRLLTTLYTNNTTNTNYTKYTEKSIETPSVLEEIIINLIKHNIIGRDFECWYPLFIINSVFNHDNFQIFLGTAENFVKEKRTLDIMEDRDTSVLIFLSNFIVGKSTDDFFSYNELNKEFNENDGSDWLNSWHLSRILKRLKVVIERRRMNRGVEVRLNFEKIRQKVKELGIESEEKEEKQEVLS